MEMPLSELNVCAYPSAKIFCAGKIKRSVIKSQQPVVKVQQAAD
jgi:hypothetical protein